MLLSLPSRRRFSDLSESEVLGLAISSEEDDARIYATHAEQRATPIPQRRQLFVVRQFETDQVFREEKVWLISG